MAAMDQLVGLTNVLSAIQGTEGETKTKTKGTQTVQTNVSDQGVNKLIQDILQGPGGVRSIGGAARSAGLYNSTTEDLMLGDLYSRAAVSAELARSPTTTTTDQTQTTTAEQGGIAGGLGSIGTMMALSQGSKALFGDPATGSTGMLSGVGDAISGIFGGGTAAATPAATTAATSAIAPAVTGATIGAAANAIGPEIVKMGATTGAASATTAAAAGGSTAGGTAAGAGAAGASAGTAGAAATGIGMNMATAIPLGGSFLSGLLGGKDAATEPASMALSAMAGYMALGPVGLIAAPIAAIAGGFLKDMSVVCTALHASGHVSKALHKAGEKHFATVDAITKMGYWTWGEPVAKRIADGSKFWTYFTRPVTRGYLKFLGTDRGILDCLDHPLGALAYYAGETFCHWLGHAVIFYKTKVKHYN